jgi:hypothetical protein
MATDEDILSWTREDLIAEVVRLRTGIRAHRDSSGTICAGIIQSFGVCFLNQFRRILQSLPGLSFSAAASSTARHSTENFETLREWTPSPTTPKRQEYHRAFLAGETVDH